MERSKIYSTKKFVPNLEELYYKKTGRNPFFHKLIPLILFFIFHPPFHVSKFCLNSSLFGDKLINHDIMIPGSFCNCSLYSNLDANLITYSFEVLS